MSVSWARCTMGQPLREAGQMSKYTAENGVHHCYTTATLSALRDDRPVEQGPAAWRSDVDFVSLH